MFYHWNILLSVYEQDLPGGTTEDSSHVFGGREERFPSAISRSQHRTSQQRSTANSTSLFVPDHTLRNALCVCEAARKRGGKRKSDVKTGPGVKKKGPERTDS